MFRDVREYFPFCQQMFYDLCGNIFPFISMSFIAHSYGLYNSQLWVVQPTVVGYITHNCGQ